MFFAGSPVRAGQVTLCPGRPEGSPGMPGTTNEPFTIAAVDGTGSDKPKVTPSNTQSASKLAGEHARHVSFAMWKSNLRRDERTTPWKAWVE